MTAKHRGKILEPSILGLMPRLLGRVYGTYSLCVEPLDVHELRIPSLLNFFLGIENGQALSAAVCAGDSVKTGQPLARLDENPRRPSPIQGTVIAVGDAPDVRAGKPGCTITIEPSSETSAQAFTPLDPEQADVEEIRKRLREACVRNRDLQPVFFDQGLGVSPLVVLAADQEPGVCVCASLLRDRKEDVGRALCLLGRIGRANQVLLATAEPLASGAAQICQASKAKLLKLAPRYPESLQPMVVRRIGDPKAVVIPLETALAIFDAVIHGQVQERKTLTLIRSGAGPSENIRVMLGTRLIDLVQACDLKLHERDKLFTGGPMRGFAQYSLQASVDEGIDAVGIVRADQLIPTGDNPCINCGACIDVCPLRLQVQLIGRYSEFGKFEPIRDLSIDQCIECGLCASFCTARRPLLQLIRMAKQQLETAGEGVKCMEQDAPSGLVEGGDPPIRGG